MTTSTEDLERISQAVQVGLEASRVVSSEKHKMHHDYLERQIARDLRREEFWIKVKGNIVMAAILGGLGWAGTVLWHAAVNQEGM